MTQLGTHPQRGTPPQARSLRALISDLANDVQTPTRAVELSLERIDNAEPQIRAWVSVDADGAREAARLQQQRGRHGALWGVPVGIKDIIDVAGQRTGCGSVIRDGTIAQTDADCVTALRRAGGIVLGKTVTTEFGYFTPGPTRNPWNLQHTPGGSSSGSAAAVAAGMVPLAFGTQTAGSLTRPAAFCGVAGLATAVGEFSLRGVTGLSPSLDSLGLLAATVTDLSFAWSALSGNTDSTGSTDSTDELPRPPRLLRWEGSDLGAITPEMTSALGTTMTKLGSDGASVADLGEDPLLHSLVEAQTTVMAYEACRERSADRAQPQLLSGPLVALFTAGLAISDDEYLAARASIAAARRHILRRLDESDAILGPAALGAAPVGTAATGSPVLSRPWQALGLPVVTIPGLRTSSGMPLGLQLIGRPGHERHLFAVARWIEARLPS